MITLKVYTNTVNRALRDLQRRVKQRGQVNKSVSIYLHRWVIENFKTEGAKVGGWEELKPSTVRSRLRKSRAGKKQKQKARAILRAGGGRRTIQAATTVRYKILQDTGNLRQSFAPFSDSQKAGVGALASKGVDYAVVHEEGGKHVPQRRMLPTRQEVMPDVLRIYNRWLERQARGSGL